MNVSTVLLRRRAAAAACALTIVLLAALPARADNAPSIVDVVTSGSRVHIGDTFTVTVRTRNASTVIAHFVNQTVPLQPSGSGTYLFSYKVPWVPFFLKRTYSMKIVATSASGETASRTIPVTLE